MCPEIVCAILTPMSRGKRKNCRHWKWERESWDVMHGVDVNGECIVIVLLCVLLTVTSIPQDTKGRNDIGVRDGHA